MASDSKKIYEKMVTREDKERTENIKPLFLFDAQARILTNQAFFEKAVFREIDENLNDEEIEKIDHKTFLELKLIILDYFQKFVKENGISEDKNPYVVKKLLTQLKK